MLATLDQDLDIPCHLQTQAQQLRDQLLASNRSHSVLLHGDLHHENIIKSDTGWVTIDPRGIIGEPLFDVCAFIYNPIDELLKRDNVTRIIEQRIEAFVTRLGYSRQRIIDWLYVRTVWVWMEWLKLKQDSAEAKQFITILESLSRE